MMRLENQILDMYDDLNYKATLKEFNVPEGLRKEAAPSMAGKANKPDHAFALCLLTKHANKLLKYPIDTPVDAYMSSEYLQRNYTKLPEGAVKIAALNIDRACKRFGIKPTSVVKTASAACTQVGNIYMENSAEQAGLSNDIMMKMAAAEVPLNNQAFGDSPFFYALVKKASSGEIQAKYAMPSPDYVSKAIEYFEKNSEHFSPEDRRQFAHNVCMRSREFGLPVQSATVNKYACANGYRSDVEAQISLRKAYLVDGTKQASYDALLTKQASVSPQLFAQALEVLDKRAGLDKYYGSVLPDAYASTFASVPHTKVASATVDMANTRKRELVESHFGKEVADLLAKEGAAAMEALPNAAKEVLMEIESGSIC